jgi:hypothetical protein
MRVSSWPGIAVRRTASPPLAYVPAIDVFLAASLVDAVGLVHAMLLRIQALLLPVKTLVLSGH